MTVFQLAVFSCVRLTSLGGDVMSMSCDWKPYSMYTTEELCTAAAPKIGSPVFSDVADGRTVEKTHCTPVIIIGE